MLSLIICQIYYNLVLFLFQSEIVLCEMLLDIFNTNNVLLCKHTKQEQSFSLFYLS